MEREALDLELVEARWRVGHILTSELAALAATLRGAGMDAPSLRALAETPAEDLRERGRATFERALRELGGGGMSASDSALLLSRHFAEQLLAGTITPRAAAKAIARVRWKGRAEVDAELLAFERLDCAYEEAEDNWVRRLVGARRLDAQVRREARKLLGR